MKKIISAVLVVVSFGVYAQDRDPSKIGHVAKDTMATPTYTYDLNDPLVAKYEYAKPQPKHDNIISRTEADSTYDLKGVFKFHLTSLLADKASLSYERVFKYKYSWELQGAYIFANPAYDGITQAIWPNIAFKNVGGEVRFGLNLLNVKPYRSNNEKLRSKGLYIAYRYQHADNVEFSTDGKGGKGYHYNYHVSQTKNLVGLFYRNRFFKSDKAISGESFYEIGCYMGMARTVCFSYVGAYGDDRGEPMAVQSVGMPFENGFVFWPVLRVGYAIRYNTHYKH
jgi:hypothetical protein